MDDRRVTIRELILGFMQASLTSVGGAAAPLRHMIVRRCGWLTEEEFAEAFGICQILPGAVGANVSVLVGDRFAGWRGGLLSVLAFSVPAMIVAVTLAIVALQLATLHPRIANAELGITSAAAGLFLSNGLRSLRLLWSGERDATVLFRALRVLLVGLGVALVVAWHFSLPAVVVVLLSAGVLLEWTRERRDAGRDRSARP